MTNISQHRFYLASLFIAIKLSAFAQSPQWQWAQIGAGNSTADIAKGLAIDAYGNTYLNGSFASTSITFGSIVMANPGGGGADNFLVKHDASGNVLWATCTGGAAGNSQGNGVTVDAAGNPYAAGLYEGSNCLMDTILLPPSANSDIFIARYDTSGNIVMAQTFGGSGDDAANDIAVDANGNYYITGYFKSPTITFGSTVLTNPDSNFADVFVVKLNAAGTVLWAKRAGGNFNENSVKVRVTPSGDVIIGGHFSSLTMSFGTTSLTNYGLNNVFVAKYDAAGNLLWADNVGGPQSDFCYGMDADPAGNIYVTGRLTSAVMYCSGIINILNSNVSGGNSDVFLIKYNPAGNAVWGRAAGLSNKDDEGQGVTCDASGNIYLTGNFNTGITFGSTTLTNTGLSSDVFVAKYDSAGLPLWAISAQGAYQDLSRNIAVDNAGNPVVAGDFFSLSMVFGTFTLTGSTNKRIFIAKVSAPTGITYSIENIPHFSVFPNPFSSSVFVSVSKPNAKQIVIAVVNNLGQIVFNAVEINSVAYYQKQVDLSALSNGIYFMMVTVDGVRRSVKIIKE